MAANDAFSAAFQGVHSETEIQEVDAEARKKDLSAEEEMNAKTRIADEAERAKRLAELEALRQESLQIYKVDESAVAQMADGFIGLTQPVVDSCCVQLAQLQGSQTELIELLAQEDRKVMTLPHMAEVAQVLSHFSHPLVLTLK